MTYFPLILAAVDDGKEQVANEWDLMIRRIGYLIKIFATAHM